MQETQVQSLGQEDALEEEIPTPLFLPGESHGQKSLVGYTSQGLKESDMTEQLNNNHHKDEVLTTGRPGSFPLCFCLWMQTRHISPGILISFCSSQCQ